MNKMQFDSSLEQDLEQKRKARLYSRLFISTLTVFAVTFCGSFIFTIYGLVTHNSWMARAFPAFLYLILIFGFTLGMVCAYIEIMDAVKIDKKKH